MIRKRQSDQVAVFLNDAVHPEIFELVKAESLASINKILLTGYSFTKRDTYLLRLIRLLSPSISFKIERRIIEEAPGLKVIRAGSMFAGFRLVLRLLPVSLRTRKVLNLELLLERCHRVVAARTLARICKKFSPSVVVYLSTYEVHAERSPRSWFFRINFHGVATSEETWHEIASLNWPEWSLTWRVEKVPNKTHDEVNIIDVYSSTFSAKISEIGQENVRRIVPIGADSSIVNWKRCTETCHFSMPEVPKFLFVGSLTLRKGLPDLLAAFETIQTRAELVILGNGSIEAIKLIAKYSGDSIKVLQNATREQVLSAMSEADYYVLPSYFEGFGIAIVEAMTLGCIPIVSRNTCGPDVLSGTSFVDYLFSAGDVSTLRNILVRCVEQDENERSRLKLESRDIGTKYSYENFGKVMGSLIIEAMCGKLEDT